MPTDYSKIGAIIKEARKEEGITTYELANRLDISQPYISAIENGNASISIKQANRILETLGRELEFTAS